MLDALKLGMPGYDMCYVSIYEQLQRHTVQVELLYGVFALNDLALLFSNNWHANKISTLFLKCADMIISSYCIKVYAPIFF